MNIFMAVLGVLITFFSFMGGVTIYSIAKSSIHEIYAALLMITSALGLVICAVSIGAATIRSAIIDAREVSTAERLRVRELMAFQLDQQQVASGQTAPAGEQLRAIR
jgi:hypothetical protein